MPFVPPIINVACRISGKFPYLTVNSNLTQFEKGGTYIRPKMLSCFGKTVKSTLPKISVVSNDLNQSAPILFLSSSSLIFLYFIRLCSSVTVSS